MKASDKPILETRLYSAKDVPAEMTVLVTVTRHWYGLIVLILLVGLLLSAAIGMPWRMIRSAMYPPPTTEPPKPDQPASLEEVQSRYQKNSKQGWRALIGIVPILVVMFFVVSRTPMEDAVSWIPGPIANNAMPFMGLVFVPIVIGIVASSLIRRKRGQPVPESSGANMLRRSMLYFLIPMILVTVVLMLLRTMPSLFWNVPTQVLRPVMLTLAVAPIPLFMYSLFRQSRKDMTKLGPGDLDYDTAVEMGRKANVRVQRVLVREKVDSVNAAATFFGTVMITKGARERLSADERGAILAHEIGHLKANHVPWFVFLTLVGSFAWLSLYFWIRDLTRSSTPGWLAPVLDSPLVGWFSVSILSVVFITPLRRRAEHSADKFALEETRNYSLVATMLAKVHLFNAAPHTYNRADAFFASHPSLTRRLDKLRSVALSLGLPVDDSEVDRLMKGNL